MKKYLTFQNLVNIIDKKSIYNDAYITYMDKTTPEDVNFYPLKYQDLLFVVESKRNMIALKNYGI